MAGCQPATPSAAPAAKAAAPAHYTYEVVNTFPHDRGAFTQGLVFLDGRMFESTGLNGESSLREVDLATGKVLRQRTVSSQYFAEGLAVIGTKAYQLTWQDHKGFVYDRDSFQPIKEFSYTGEGWGLTTDGHSLILSDGTNQLRFLNPETFAVERTIDVRLDGKPVNDLN
jgi:glutamine cyclotransferase